MSCWRVSVKRVVWALARSTSQYVRAVFFVSIVAVVDTPEESQENVDM